MNIPSWLKEIPGQTSNEEIEALATLARETPAHLDVVEIGAYRGRTALALAWGAGRRIFSVDPHIYFQGPLGHTFYEYDMAMKYHNLAESPVNVAENVACVTLRSSTASRIWEFSGRIGLLFIDGDHDRASEDVLLWGTAVNPHVGVVAFHDCDYRGVDDAIEKNKNWLKEEGSVGNLKWFRSQ